MQRTSPGAFFFAKSFKFIGYLGILGLLASVASANTVTRERDLLDAGWRFQLGDPVDVTTNVTVYPEIPDLTKLEDSGTGAEFTGANSETNLMTLRPDPVATHAGENVSFVMTNYNDSAWRLLNLPHDWVVELGFDQNGDASHGYKATSGNTIAWYRHTFTLPAGDAGKVMWLEFDGIYRNALIWLNGRCIGRERQRICPHFVRCDHQYHCRRDQCAGGARGCVTQRRLVL